MMIWRLQDLFVQNFFVLLNRDKLIETPDLLYEYESQLFSMYKNAIIEQIYLQDEGVSFSYTDNIDNQTRKDLIEILVEWREDHPRLSL